MNHEDKIKAYLSEPGGPFYELQLRLGILRENAFRAEKRAAGFVTICWGVPFLLTIIQGKAFGVLTDQPYIYEFGNWARYFIAVGLFILMEKKVEERLSLILKQFFNIPIFTDAALEPAAQAINKALKKRESRAPEIICFAIALTLSLVTFFRLSGLDEPGWAINITESGRQFSYAAWWIVLVSNPVFWFLLFRWLWRLCIFSELLRDFAKLEMRLVVTHPDNNGGLGFIGEYPNAYATFVFAISCMLGATIAQEFASLGLTPVTFGYLMAVWLLIVFALFSYPLLAFKGPLIALKNETLLVCGGQATRFHRALEKEILGKNIVANNESENTASSEISNPTLEYNAAKKLSTALFSRLGLLPVAAAALIPLLIAASTQLPVRELFKMVRKLLLI